MLLTPAAAVLQAGQAGGCLAPSLVHAAAVPLPKASPAAPAARQGQQAQPQQRAAPTQLPSTAARLQQVLSPAGASPGTTQAAAQLVALSQRRSRGLVGRQLQWHTPRPQLAAVDMSISEPEQVQPDGAGTSWGHSWAGLHLQQHFSCFSRLPATGCTRAQKGRVCCGSTLRLLSGAALCVCLTELPAPWTGCSDTASM